MFGASYQVAKIWGIPVKVHISLVVLLVYVGLSGGLAAGRQHGWATGGLAVLVNMLLMALVFVSVALHELGHSFIALRKGCRVRQITLMIIGGAAQMEQIPSRPRDEFRMAIAGPLVSLTIGLLTLTAGTWLRGRGWALPGFLLVNLGLINLLLAGFNLLPAFPMDGGRILRAALSGRMGRLKATRIAARIGRWVAFLMGIFGISYRNWFLVAIAFFIYTAAGAEYRMLQFQQTFRPMRRFFGGFDQDPDDEGDGMPDDGCDDDGSVVIGPPPYRKEPAVRVDVRRERRF